MLLLHDRLLCGIGYPEAFPKTSHDIFHQAPIWVTRRTAFPRLYPHGSQNLLVPIRDAADVAPRPLAIQGLEVARVGVGSCEIRVYTHTVNHYCDPLPEPVCWLPHCPFTIQRVLLFDLPFTTPSTPFTTCASLYPRASLYPIVRHSFRLLFLHVAEKNKDSHSVVTHTHVAIMKLSQLPRWSFLNSCCTITLFFGVASCPSRLYPCKRSSYVARSIVNEYAQTDGVVGSTSRRSTKSPKVGLSCSAPVSPCFPFPSPLPLSFPADLLGFHLLPTSPLARIFLDVGHTLCASDQTPCMFGNTVPGPHMLRTSWSKGVGLFWQSPLT